LSAWCHLYDAAGQERAHHGLSAARVLLEMQTLAELVPALPPDQRGERNVSAPVTNRWPARQSDAQLAVTPGDQAQPSD